MTAKGKNPWFINWTAYLAITLLLALPLAVLMVRSGAWQQGLLIYAAACLGASLLLLVGLLLLLLPRFRQWRGALLPRLLPAVPGTLLLLSMLGGRGDYPPIHDITTDLVDPPRFSAASEQRGSDANSLDLVEETLELQAQYYPGLKTLLVEFPIEMAFERSLLVAKELGWEIYHEDLSGGVIEAVDTTAIMGFKDDVVIRLRTNASGTLIDLRSVSRVGISDLGANTARIHSFEQRFGELGVGL